MTDNLTLPNKKTDCWLNSPRLEEAHSKTKEWKQFNGVINRQKVDINLNYQDIHIDFIDGQKKILNFSFIFNVKRSLKSLYVQLTHLEYDDLKNLCIAKMKIKMTEVDEVDRLAKIISKALKKIHRPHNLYCLIDNTEKYTNLDSAALFEKEIKSNLETLEISHAVYKIIQDSDYQEISSNIRNDPTIDGIIIVGGDEIISKTLSKILQDQNEDLDCPSPIKVPVGIIPIGFNNDIFNAASEFISYNQAILNIALGRVIQMDILSLVMDNSVVMWGFNCQYGLWNCRTLKKTIKNRLDNYSIRYLDDEIKMEDTTKCSLNCQKCYVNKPIVVSSPVFNFTTSKKKRGKNQNGYNWQTKEGSFPLIIINSIPCKNPQAPSGLTPLSHFADKRMDVILLCSTQGKDFKKYLKSQIIGSQVNLPYVEYFKTKEIVFTNNDFLCNNKSYSEEFIKEKEKEIIIVEDLEESESSSEEETGKYIKPTQISERRKSLTVLKQKCKDIFKTTEASDGNEAYRKPVLLEFERIRDKKAQKRRSSKSSKDNTANPKWMIDYVVIDKAYSKVGIRLHSGLINIFCDYQ